MCQLTMDLWHGWYVILLFFGHAQYNYDLNVNVDVFSLHQALTEVVKHCVTWTTLYWHFRFPSWSNCCFWFTIVIPLLLLFFKLFKLLLLLLKFPKRAICSSLQIKLAVFMFLQLDVFWDKCLYWSECCKGCWMPSQQSHVAHWGNYWQVQYVWNASCE